MNMISSLPSKNSWITSREAPLCFNLTESIICSKMMAQTRYGEQRVRGHNLLTGI